MTDPRTGTATPTGRTNDERRIDERIDERIGAMHCYDCLPQGRTTFAVAVCRRCGAALCTDHVRLDPHAVHQVRGTGPAEPEPAARRITCAVCHEAEQHA